MENPTELDIASERRAYQALKRAAIAALPPYSACAAAACRAGQTICAHAARLPWNFAIMADLLKAVTSATPCALPQPAFS